MRYLTAGESHGRGLVGILEGLPAGLKVDAEQINRELYRRRQGYGRGGRMKIETDRAEIYSGVRGGVTLGSPVALVIENRDYENWKRIMGADADETDKRRVTAVRPGHADLSGVRKYGFTDARNVLERASARETAMRVALGALCKQYLSYLGVTIGSHVVEIGGVKSAYRPNSAAELAAADESDVRCMDAEAGKKMRERIDEALRNRDTLGGVVELVVSGMPPCCGSYVHYDRKLDYALMGQIGGIQAVKCVEIGEGIAGASVFGSEFQDEMHVASGRITRKTNRAGGIEGGMTNGENIVLRAYIKPIPTVMKGLDTVDIETGENTKSSTERSDCCAVPAAGVVVENVAAFVLADKLSELIGGDTAAEAAERLAIMRRRFEKL